MSYLTVYDGRGSIPTSERFEGPHAFILKFCNEQLNSYEQIRKGLQNSPLPGSDEATIIEPLVDILTTLREKRLLHEEGKGDGTLLWPFR